MSTPVRDPKLLDALESIEQRPYAGRVWRSVLTGRDPLLCWRSGARWDDGTFDVLYTSETREAAIEERRFHLFMGQPIPPSRVTYQLFEIHVALEKVITFATLNDISSLGFDTGSFGQLSYKEKNREYPRTQEIAEACFFLGADGILVPSARDPGSKKLIIFCEQDSVSQKEVIQSHGVIKWATR